MQTPNLRFASHSETGLTRAAERRPKWSKVLSGKDTAPPSPVPDHRIDIGRAKKARSRDRLIAAAAKVIAERGENGASIDAFIAEAGVSRATFYNHFKTRDDLATALWADFGRDSMRHVADVCSDIDDPAHRIGIAVSYVLRRAHVDPTFGWLFVRAAVSSGSANAELRSLVLGDLVPLAQKGAFPIDEVAYSIEFVIAATAQAIRLVLNHRWSVGLVDHFVRAILLGLGVSSRRVAKIVRAAPPAGLINF